MNWHFVAMSELSQALVGWRRATIVQEWGRDIERICQELELSGDLLPWQWKYLERAIQDTALMARIARALYVVDNEHTHEFCKYIALKHVFGSTSDMDTYMSQERFRLTRHESELRHFMALLLLQAAGRTPLLDLIVSFGCPDWFNRFSPLIPHDARIAVCKQNAVLSSNIWDNAAILQIPRRRWKRMEYTCAVSALWIAMTCESVRELSVPFLLPIETPKDGISHPEACRHIAKELIELNCHIEIEDDLLIAFAPKEEVERRLQNANDTRDALNDLLEACAEQRKLQCLHTSIFPTSVCKTCPLHELHLWKDMKIAHDPRDLQECFHCMTAMQSFEIGHVAGGWELLVPEIQKWTNLTSLTLGKFEDVDMLADIIELPHLETLHLDLRLQLKDKPRDVWMRLDESRPSLRLKNVKLNLYKCSDMELEYYRTLVRVLFESPDLESFTLDQTRYTAVYMCPLTDEWVDMLATKTRLSSLELNDCVFVERDRNVRIIEALPMSLKNLTIQYRFPIDDTDWDTVAESLGKLPNLTCMDLGVCPLRNNAFAHFHALTRLKVLRLRVDSEELTLSVDDLAALSNMKSLELLSLIDDRSNVRFNYPLDVSLESFVIPARDFTCSIDIPFAMLSLFSEDVRSIRIQVALDEADACLEQLLTTRKHLKTVTFRVRVPMDQMHRVKKRLETLAKTHRPDIFVTIHVDQIFP